MEGYIKLYRKSMKNSLFLEVPYDRWHAFEFLLFEARYVPTDIMIKGKILHLDVGQLIYGEDALAEKWGWSRGKVRRFLDLLCKQQMITKNGTAYGTLITIENYEFYQGERTSDGTTDSTSDGTTDSTSDGTRIKKEKKDNKENIINARARDDTDSGVSFSRPTSKAMVAAREAVEFYKKSCKEGD